MTLTSMGSTEIRGVPVTAAATKVRTRQHQHDQYVIINTRGTMLTLLLRLGCSTSLISL